MRYQKVIWKHSFEAEPVVIYSEVDEDGWETRKVEGFKNGTFGYASSSRESGTTWLSEKRLPSMEEIAKNSEFEPAQISKEEFEKVWHQAKGG